MERGMEKESIYFKIGKRIGYWYAENRSSLNNRIVQGILGRLPGGRIISQIFRLR